MKKYIFSILLFMGCLFLGISFNSTPVEAILNVYSVTPDSHSQRNITVSVDRLHYSTTSIRINEIEYCESTSTDEACHQYDLLDGQDAPVTYYFKILNTREYEVSIAEADAGTIALPYRIDATSDGMKYFYVDATAAQSSASTNYAFFEYNLSTLEERIVVNPDANGVSSHVYGGVQYSSVRKINVKVELLEAEKALYNGEAKVCERILVNSTMQDRYCSEYYLDDVDTLDYYIKSFGDGVKNIRVYLFKSSTTEDPLIAERDIYIDTIGPEIKIEGGTWIYLKTGTQYKVQKATCVDNIFEEDECTVTNDADVIQLDYKSDKYQFVTYSATDRLGNTRTVSVKIRVEQPTKDDNVLVPVLVGGGIFLVVLLILGWILIKNHQKKKKISYI